MMIYPMMYHHHPAGVELQRLLMVPPLSGEGSFHECSSSSAGNCFAVTFVAHTVPFVARDIFAPCPLLIAAALPPHVDVLVPPFALVAAALPPHVAVLVPPFALVAAAMPPHDNILVPPFARVPFQPLPSSYRHSLKTPQIHHHLHCSFHALSPPGSTCLLSSSFSSSWH